MTPRGQPAADADSDARARGGRAPGGLLLGLIIGLTTATVDIYRADVCPKITPDCPPYTALNLEADTCSGHPPGVVRAREQLVGVCVAATGCPSRLCEARCTCGLDESLLPALRCTPPERCHAARCRPGATRCRSPRVMQVCDSRGEWKRASCKRCEWREDARGRLAVCLDVAS